MAGDKRFAGSISGGCLEQALTEEAQIAMKEGANRTLRYGTGSPYLDVRLPCGGGIDLFVDVNVDREVLQRAIALGRARHSFSLLFDPASTRSSLRLEEQTVQAKPGEFSKLLEQIKLKDLFMLPRLLVMGLILKFPLMRTQKSKMSIPTHSQSSLEKLALFIGRKFMGLKLTQ